MEQNILNSFPFGIVFTNSKGIIKYINNVANEIFHTGTSERNIINQSIFKYISTSNIIQAIKKEKCIYSTVNFNMQSFIMFENKSIAQNPDEKTGIIILFKSNFIDKLAFHSKKVKEINQELNLIMNLIGDLVTITDGQGRISKVNDACERIMGVSMNDFIGKSMDLLEKEQIIDLSSTKKVIKEGRRVNLVQTTKSGRKLLVSGYPIFDKEGKLVKIINISKDVTETNRLSRELEETKKLIRDYERKLLEKDGNNQPLIKSKQMTEIYELLQHIADVDSTVLILGESGVGKEVLARSLHKYSERRNKPFIKINCGAIPETLMESELFGYAKGSFTGANRDGKEGLILAADKGTLFLDEIGELPLQLQVKLLQVLQERQVTPIGKSTPRDVDVRIVAATNRNLEEMVKDKLFRSDLYYRLNVVPIKIPSLMERKEEIPYLASYFLEKFNKKYEKRKVFDQEVLKIFSSYHWPGNVRELQNIVERLVVTTSQTEISVHHLPENIVNGNNKETNIHFENLTLKESVENLERQIIETTLKDCVSLKEAGKKLGVDASTLSRKIRRLNIKIAKMQ
ncbi:sigma-54-dependent Fis family transcriptional regulator [Neobacillus mesonae]|uniref:sigma-54 interaction domain-containing protein n=1 Tax=Neobacillus mesonae TaxID=1193713 RepID=UPI00203E5CD3|nr:sigma 54-interacting transcriptional regulator [Neobacillus mesonae]MCM3569294.1 sigma 54-interacting transcriptional regulator [Neobacillus mesonae]